MPEPSALLVLSVIPLVCLCAPSCEKLCMVYMKFFTKGRSWPILKMISLEVTVAHKVIWT